MRITSNLVHFISIFLVGESIQVPIKASIVLQRHAKESSGFRGKSGMESKEIVLKHQIKENANFIGLNTIPYIICFFAARGQWPDYAPVLGQRIEQISRQIFELDDNRLRAYCRRHYEVQKCHRPFSPFGCCTQFPPTRTTTDRFGTVSPPDNTATYTGTGTGDYTGEEDGTAGNDEEEADNSNNNYNDNNDAEGIKEPPKKIVQFQATPNPDSEKISAQVPNPKENLNGKLSVIRSFTTSFPNKHREIRSLRHRDVVVSFADRLRKRHRN